MTIRKFTGYRRTLFDEFFEIEIEEENIETAKDHVYHMLSTFPEHGKVDKQVKRMRRIKNDLLEISEIDFEEVKDSA